MKLTGWYRIGIVLSILWCFVIIGVTILQYNNPMKNSDTTKKIITTEELFKLDNPKEYGFPYLVTYEPDITKPKPHLSTLPLGFKLDPPDPERDYFMKPVINYGNIFLSMIIPVVSGWFLIFTIIVTVKWIIKGFRNKEK